MMNIYDRIKRWAAKRRVFLAICFLLPLYHAVIVNGFSLLRVNNITYSFYAVDYSMGFCSGLLPGSVYRLLVGVYEQRAVTIYLTVLYLLFIIMIAYLAQRFSDAFPNNRKECLLLGLLFFTGPFTFSMFAKQFGMLDFYWIFLFYLSVLCLHNRHLKFLIPVFTAFTVMTNYGGLLCYSAALYLLLILRIANSTSKQEQIADAVVLLLSLITGVGFTFYFVMNDTSNAVYTLEEFHRITMDERHASPSYYDYSLYKNIDIYLKNLTSYMDDGTREAFTEAFYRSSVRDTDMSIQKLVDTILFQFRLTFSLKINRKKFFVNAVGLVPQIFLSAFIVSYIKKKEKRFQKLIMSLVIVLPFAVEIAGMVVSTDNTRWFGNSFIILLTFVFYILYSDWQEGMRTVEAFFSKPICRLLPIFLFLYAFICVDPYTFV